MKTSRRDRLKRTSSWLRASSSTAASAALMRAVWIDRLQRYDRVDDDDEEDDTDDGESIDFEEGDPAGGLPANTEILLCVPMPLLTTLISSQTLQCLVLSMPRNEWPILAQAIDTDASLPSLSHLAWEGRPSKADGPTTVERGFWLVTLRPLLAAAPNLTHLDVNMTDEGCPPSLDVLLDLLASPRRPPPPTTTTATSITGTTPPALCAALQSLSLRATNDFDLSPDRLSPANLEDLPAALPHLTSLRAALHPRDLPDAVESLAAFPRLAVLDLELVEWAGAAVDDALSALAASASRLRFVRVREWSHRRLGEGSVYKAVCGGGELRRVFGIGEWPLFFRGEFGRWEETWIVQDWMAG
ncbi:hypothetical protein DFJ73DRAFT_772610 [Zopfochytrium polystomum]|nr:hypothetical protein DFJ73DRAFT_772610 [Zopfochytrium polystomum]